jgi:hypothetical protein
MEVLVSNHSSMSWITDYDMKAGPNNTAIIAFSDVRENGSDFRPHAYCIGPDGTFLWGADGITLSNAGTFEPDPKIAVSQAGNIYICWQSDRTTPSSIVIQKISPEGILFWADPLVISSTDNSGYEYPVMSPVHGDFAVSDEVILLWEKRASTSMYAPRHILAQKIGAAGTILWDNDTVVTDAGGIPIYERITFMDDMMGGVYVAWFDDRDGTGMFQTYLQHVTSGGGINWTGNGVNLFNNPSKMFLYPSIVFSEMMGMPFVFTEMRNANQDQWGIAHQGVMELGEVLSTLASYIEVVPLGNQQITGIKAFSKLHTISSGAHYLFDLFFLQYAFGNVTDAQVVNLKLNETNIVHFPNEIISSVQSSKQKLVVANQVGQQSYVAAWVDGRNGDSDIYAQSIAVNGNLGAVVANDNPIQPVLQNKLVNYPNPFKNSTSFRFQLSKDEPCQMSVYNLKGQKVWQTKQNGKSGSNEISWNGKDEKGHSVSAGVYISKLNTAHQQLQKKIVVMQ